MTLEVLRDQSNYSIDINDIDAIAYDLQCERNAYLEFIEFSIEVGLFVKKNGKISSNSFLNRMEHYETKSNKARESALKRWSNRREKGNAKAMRTHSEGNAIEMHRKDSIVKEKDTKGKYLDFVTLTLKEHNSLINEYGESQTKEMIQRLNDYIGSKGNKYKSHYHTIKNWFRRDGGTSNLSRGGSEKLRILANVNAMIEQRKEAL
jgi:hypothetical protein